MDFKNSFVAEWYDRTDFFDAKFFLLGSFFAHFFQKWWIKKWPQQKKLVKWKISFFMPINHVQKFMISVHSRIVICPFCIGGSIHLQSPCTYYLMFAHWARMFEGVAIWICFYSHMFLRQLFKWSNVFFFIQEKFVKITWG